MSEMTVEKFVGIDVSKGTLDLCIEPAGETLHVDYDDKGISQIVNKQEFSSGFSRAPEIYSFLMIDFCVMKFSD